MARYYIPPMHLHYQIWLSHLFWFFLFFLYVDFITLHIVSMFFNVPCRTACWFMFRNTKALQLFGWIMMLSPINYLFSPSFVVCLEYISILISKAWGQLFRILKCTLHSKQHIDHYLHISISIDHKYTLMYISSGVEVVLQRISR